jgi:hypothetical protein
MCVKTLPGQDQGIRDVDKERNKAVQERTWIDTTRQSEKAKGKRERERERERDTNHFDREEKFREHQAKIRNHRQLGEFFDRVASVPYYPLPQSLSLL